MRMQQLMYSLDDVVQMHAKDFDVSLKATKIDPENFRIINSKQLIQVKLSLTGERRAWSK